MPTSLPPEIKSKIEEALSIYDMKEKDDRITKRNRELDITFGYSLAEGEIENWKEEYSSMETIISEYQSSETKQQNEIERLRGLLERLFKNQYSHKVSDEFIKSSWQQFKTKNNL